MLPHAAMCNVVFCVLCSIILQLCIFWRILEGADWPWRVKCAGCRVTVAEGLQEVEASKITMNQLRNIIKAKRMHKDFNINIKSLSKPFQYAAFAFLKHNIVTFTDRWTPHWSTITRENAAKVGTHWLTSAQWTKYMHANSSSAAAGRQTIVQWRYCFSSILPPSA